MAKRRMTAAQRRKAGLPLHLSLSPQRINRDQWYYENPRHIDVVVWATARNGERLPVHARITWKALEASIRRYRAYKRAHSAGAEPQ